MTVYATLNDLLEALMAHPDELFINESQGSCAIYYTLHGAFLFLDGNFTGDEAQDEAEMDRIMEQIKQGRV